MCHRLSGKIFQGGTMNHPFNGILKSLEPVQDFLLQVCVYQDLSDSYHAVVILEEDPADWFQKMASLSRFIHKKGLTLPLIINRKFIQNSLDSYPLEFINIASSVKQNLLAKEDLLANLQFDQADVRLQMEREFKSKWLLTRQVILEGRQNSRNLREAIHLSIKSLIPAFKGFFLLGNQPYPQSLRDLFEQAAIISNTDLLAMHRWLYEKNIEVSDAERYLDILSKLMQKMESFPVE